MLVLVQAVCSAEAADREAGPAADPISLQAVTDALVVDGVVYERRYMSAWLRAGRRMHPSSGDAFSADGRQGGSCS